MPYGTPSLNLLMYPTVSLLCPQVSERWETVPNSEIGKSCLQEHVATDPGLALHKLAGQPLPQLPLVSSSASRPKAFLAPSLPWAHRVVWKTKNQSSHRRLMQELTRGLLLRSELQLPLITAYCYKPLEGKPQPQQVWAPALNLHPGHSATSTGESWSLWAAMDYPRVIQESNHLAPSFWDENEGKGACQC